MKEEAKQKIVEALRSGRYQQGEDFLRVGDCYCVWGVICDVSGVDEWWKPSAVSQKFSYGRQRMIPEVEVLQWAGLVEDAEVSINGLRMTLMQHNDNGATFKQLAEAIERQL